MSSNILTQILINASMIECTQHFEFQLLISQKYHNNPYDDCRKILMLQYYNDAVSKHFYLQ